MTPAQDDLNNESVGHRNRPRNDNKGLTNGLNGYSGRFNNRAISPRKTSLVLVIVLIGLPILLRKRVRGDELD